jgi:hypothetical protein
VEQRTVADRSGLLREGDSSRAERLIEALDGFKASVCERLVDEGPKMFGRLQFGAVGGLEDETDAIGHDQVLRAMPAGIVDLKHAHKDRTAKE